MIFLVERLLWVETVLWGEQTQMSQIGHQLPINITTPCYMLLQTFFVTFSHEYEKGKRYKGGRNNHKYGRNTAMGPTN